MAKISKSYLDVDTFKIIETGFHPDRAEVSESIFSLANEYMGVRASFPEGYSGPSLIGTYFNGFYEYSLSDTPSAYKGIVKRTHFTINSTNFFKVRIEANGHVLDLNKSSFSSFRRELDMLSGLYTRSFIWHIDDTNIEITFKRMLNMIHCHEAIQQISFKANKDIDIKISFYLDNSIIHWRSDCYINTVNKRYEDGVSTISAKTLSTHQSLSVSMIIDSSFKDKEISTSDKEIWVTYKGRLNKEKNYTFTRYVDALVNKESDENILSLENQSIDEVKQLAKKGFAKSLNENINYFNDLWELSDIEIDGDDKNQQGIRYCIFQLAQTYHGYSKDNNIGAKGLTGEAYSGHAFWDSETYCLPYYLFTNQTASKNLLMFRYNTLHLAKERAKMLDCTGACFPVATRNGEEACNLWQHASLQFQPSTAVMYAIYHYMNLYDDKHFMQEYGLEMVVEIAKFLLSRGDYNQDKSKFSFYNVMGPDEFQMMVNHNTYTNFMAKKTFDYLINLYESSVYDFKKIEAKCDIEMANFIDTLKDVSNKMVILYDEKSQLFEQHDGFFDLPHIDIHSIDEKDFPLYSSWSYDRIYRNDMIKQPDVLMFMFLYNSDFTFEQKKNNYEYYEPRCIHESSLSPSIHSILACELNKLDEAKNFFEFATRLDLDDYNNNTKEGIHTTSIAAAWMNIVYGFGGLRSDREILKLNPSILPEWNYYSFKIKYHNSLLKVKVDKKYVEINLTGQPVEIQIYDKKYLISSSLKVEKIR